jgi:hypothetical protein
MPRAVLKMHIDGHINLIHHLAYLFSFFARSLIGRSLIFHRVPDSSCLAIADEMTIRKKIVDS